MGGEAVIPVWLQLMAFKGFGAGYACIDEQHVLTVFQVYGMFNLQLEIGEQVNIVQLVSFQLVLFKQFKYSRAECVVTARRVAIGQYQHGCTHGVASDSPVDLTGHSFLKTVYQFTLVIEKIQLHWHLAYGMCRT